MIIPLELWDFKVLIMLDGLDSNDLQHLYNSADCYISPNLGEGYGLTIIDAMLSELPVIVSRCGAPLDFVNRTTGLFIDLNSDKPTQPITDLSLINRDRRYEGLEIYNLDYNSL